MIRLAKMTYHRSCFQALVRYVNYYYYYEHSASGCNWQIYAKLVPYNFFGFKFSVKSRADGQKNSKRNGVESKPIQNVIEYR